ncbi:MAG: hypothetical protein IID37_03315 [Planctomycetes bacterium]|nr:hypothetical protein [Planctomycetota bacterium]
MAVSYLLLALAVLAAHGWSLGDKLFLDDHWHVRQLREAGWQPADLLDSTTLVPARFMDMWWQEKPIEWHYARPLSVLLMKVVFHLSGHSVVAQHAVSLLLHWICACMVRSLCLSLTRCRPWALVGGLLFVVYSHSVFAVAWLAAQNTVLQTTLTLGALLCYLRASGLRLGPPGVDRSSLATPIFNWSMFLCSAILLVLGMLSRENAVVFPVIALAMDLSFGGFRHAKRRWAAHLVFGLLALLYTCWRLLIFHHPMPDVYFRRPDGLEYIAWCLAKLMHYLTSSVWLSPMTIGPTGRFNPWVEALGDCVLMLSILFVLGTGYVLACRKVRGFWIWPLWILLSVLPVVPVLATPHSGYMSGVGFAVALVLRPGLGRHIRPRWIGRCCCVVTIWFLVATTTYMPIYRTLWNGVRAGEELTIAQILRSPPPQETTDVFFINVPFVNIYAQVQLADAWNGERPPVRCHTLVFSPTLLAMDQPCTVEQLDEYRLAVSVRGRPYFSGLLGRFLVDGMRDSGRFTAGQQFCGELFDIEVVRVDAQGVQELVFTFREPLASSQYTFYVSTQTSAAARLNLWGPGERVKHIAPQPRAVTLAEVNQAVEATGAGRADAAMTLFAATQGDDLQLRERAGRALLPIARHLAAATANPIADQLTSNVIPEINWSLIEAWWLQSIDDRTIVDLWVGRDQLRDLRDSRDQVSAMRRRTATIIRTDLYLSGPPFPGPQ